MERDLSFYIRIERLKQARKREKIDEKELLDFLTELKNKKLVFNSQGELLEKIKRTFKDKNLPSKEKIRKIAIKVGYKIKYVTKKVEKELEKCPICDSPLFEKYDVNLKGEKSVIYYFCKFCGFKTKDKRDLPIKFRFIL